MRKTGLLAIVLMQIFTAPALAQQSDQQIVPADWDPALAGDLVMERFITVTADHVKGAHDSAMAIVDGHAYIVAEVNDFRAGEEASWPEVYCTLSIVNLESLTVESVLEIARSEQVFDNYALPVGACFVPRILQIDDQTLRCYFASEQPGRRQSQIWYRDFNLSISAFAQTIHQARLRTSEGVFPMQPKYFHADAVAFGFTKPAQDYGLYIFDSFKVINGRTYVALNNYPGKQNALAVLRDDFATFEIVGHYNEPLSAKLSESAIQRLPDGSWMAICRNESGNYLFTVSPDGNIWSPGRELPYVLNGSNSKPTFDKFGDLYYLGWQERRNIEGVTRSVFNVDISRDCLKWERKYRFETTRSFQYPTFCEDGGVVWLCVTQGDKSPSRKERIMFGKLEDLGAFPNQEGRTRALRPDSQ